MIVIVSILMIVISVGPKNVWECGPFGQSIYCISLDLSEGRALQSAMDSILELLSAL